MEKVYYSSAWTGIVTPEETWHRAGIKFRELCRKPRTMFRNILLIAGSLRIASGICEVDLGFSRVSFGEWRSYGGACIRYIPQSEHIRGIPRDTEILIHPSAYRRRDWDRFSEDVHRRFTKIYNNYEDIK